MRAAALVLGVCLVASGVDAGAQQAAGIFTCIDRQGRRLTSDRPVAECIDVEQEELNPSGTVRRRLTPPPTAKEREEQEARQRKAAEEHARQDEEKRRERALLIRYPNRARHDHERAEALRQINEVIRTAEKRLVDIAEERKRIEAELEFYRRNPAKVPAPLRRQLDDNARATLAQKDFIADKEAEKTRIHARFDEELVRLQQLWAAAGSPAAAQAASAPPASR